MKVKHLETWSLNSICEGVIKNFVKNIKHIYITLHIHYITYTYTLEEMQLSVQMTIENTTIHFNSLD